MEVKKQEQEKPDEPELLPNGMISRVKIVLNPEPNLHLNIGKH